MKYLTLIPVLCLLLVPSVANSQQISPNPNYGTINVDTDGSYNKDSFSNFGTILIESTGKLENHDKISNGGAISVNGSYENVGSSEINNKGTFKVEKGHLSTTNPKISSVKNTWFKNWGTVTTDENTTWAMKGYFNNGGSGGDAWKDSSFTNKGTITNDGNSHPGYHGGLENYSQFTNEGTITNTGSVWNWHVFDNAKGAKHGTIPRGGVFNNTKTGWVYLGDGQHDASVFNNDNEFTNDGTLHIAARGLDKIPYPRFNNGGVLNSSATFTNTKNGTVDCNGAFNNYGTFTNDGHLNPWNYGIFTNETSGYFKSGVDGKVSTGNHGFFINKGHISGGGVVAGLTDTGTLSPGDSAGVMTIDGDYYKRGGSHEIELGGLFDGGGDHAITEFDWIDVTGNVELAGLLNVSLIDGFEKRINRGQVFEFLRVGGTLSGQYEGLGEGALVGNFGGQDLFITYGGMGDGGGVALFTNAVPEPTTMLIWSMLAGLGMTTRRRRAA